VYDVLRSLLQALHPLSTARGDAVHRGAVADTT
jgi:hypothetical protein